MKKYAGICTGSESSHDINTVRSRYKQPRWGKKHSALYLVFKTWQDLYQPNGSQATRMTQPSSPIGSWTAVCDRSPSPSCGLHCVWSSRALGAQASHLRPSQEELVSLGGPRGAKLSWLRNKLESRIFRSASSHSSESNDWSQYGGNYKTTLSAS